MYLNATGVRAAHELTLASGCQGQLIHLGPFAAGIAPVLDGFKRIDEGTFTFPSVDDFWRCDEMTLKAGDLPQKTFDQLKDTLKKLTQVANLVARKELTVMVTTLKQPLGAMPRGLNPGWYLNSDPKHNMAFVHTNGSVIQTTPFDHSPGSATVVFGFGLVGACMVFYEMDKVFSLSHPSSTYTREPLAPSQVTWEGFLDVAGKLFAAEHTLQSDPIPTTHQRGFWLYHQGSEFAQKNGIAVPTYEKLLAPDARFDPAAGFRMISYWGHKAELQQGGFFRPGLAEVAYQNGFLKRRIFRNCEQE